MNKLNVVRHAADHLYAVLKFMFRNPGWAFRMVPLGVSEAKNRGWRRLRERVARHCAKLLRGTHKDGCSLCAWIQSRLTVKPPAGGELQKWYLEYRPGEKLLSSFRAETWPANAPKFVIVIPLKHPNPSRVAQAIQSVLDQTYPHWNLICTADGAMATAIPRSLRHQFDNDARIRFLHSELRRPDDWTNAARNETPDYVCLLRENDALEPHALHRFAHAIIDEAPDILYSDAIHTGGDLDEIQSLELHPTFSYDYFLTGSCIENLIAFRTSLLQDLERDLPTFSRNPFETLLRSFENGRSICHVPDILVRCRDSEAEADTTWNPSNDPKTPLVTDHLRRCGLDAHVESFAPSLRRITFARSPDAKVAIIIPTHNQGHVLRTCLESLARTIPDGLADVHVLNHNTNDSETLSYLRGLSKAYRVTDVGGPFNFSRLMNQGVRELPKRYSHYLLLNNDTEALENGWLERMLGLACRPDIGIVGALLLYPNGSIQHGGVMIGMGGGADHLGRYHIPADPNGGFASRILRCTRDVSAVTAACMLVRAEVFELCNGLDESFAVGFGDTDFCLRARQAGYRVLFDPHAVLVHHESLTRGKSACDPHPRDTRLFLQRYAGLLQAGDPCANPLWSESQGLDFSPITGLRSQVRAQARTITFANAPGSGPSPMESIPVFRSRPARKKDRSAA